MRYSTSILALTSSLSLTSAFIAPEAFQAYPAAFFPKPFFPNPEALHTAHAPPEGVASNHLAHAPPVPITTNKGADSDSESDTIIPTEEGSHHLAHAPPVPVSADTKGKGITTSTDEGSHRLAHAPPEIEPTEEGSHRLAHAPPQLLDSNPTLKGADEASHRLAHSPPKDDATRTGEIVPLPSVIRGSSLEHWFYEHTQYNMTSVKEKTEEECKQAKPVSNIRYLPNWPTRVENNIHGKGPNTDPLIPICTLQNDIELGCWNVHMASLHAKAEAMGIDGALRSVKVNEWERDRVVTLESNCPKTDDELVAAVLRGAGRALKWDPKLEEKEAREGLALLGWGGDGTRVTLPVLPAPSMTILPVVEEEGGEMHALPVVVEDFAG
ncbi:hypothetical protein BJ508DRAFT_417691 [Ascobolus immersus RN42]|uniref:Uncharacterized protein n=1 Tax=Ascobolus immersus RN42 TaxID=1160509 RepID=A0A3N4HW95_ASCIM|nr:hypothetical protein BJ508DRAFT_417691 [Ascobolus immersus RN42]